ncbi:adenylate cyclase [Duganella sp. CF517]|uniref:CHASE2 domain-containing protein n=1 Tax=Duganella sp. CF517 TaxID=1881038 RepID=UPI0008B03E09|nr:adenylate/guanylate cyclase domain-containing protein [Duganella sp. CF517]SEO21051.1 adenylate cyclase [Duganella sp. CF517]
MTLSSPLRSPPPRTRTTRTPILLIAAAAVALGAWGQWGAGAPGDEWLRDRLLRLRADAAPDTRLALIDIDEASLAALGPWPWPRARIADLAELLLADYGARAVALDLVFPEPADGAGDARLAMLARHGPLVLAQAFDFHGALPLRVGQPTAGVAGAPGGAVVASGVVANHAGLAPATRTGNIGFIPDADGMLRRLPMQTWYEQRRYPTLSLALLQAGDAAPAMPAGGPRGAIGGAGDGLLRIPYRRAWDAYTVIPASAILAREVAPELLAGKLVLVGSSSLGLSDRVATPLSASTSGLLVHAAALSALLDARAGAAPAPLPGAAIALLFTAAVALLSAYTLARRSALANIGLLGAASLAWLALAALLLPHDGGVNSAGPLLANFFLLAAGVPFAWQMTQRQSRRLLGTLRQYVADAVVDELLRSNLADPLAPTRCEVTTLIADMQGYTGHVAALPVEQAAQLTRDFLDCLTRPVLEQHGTLDKYTGDGLVAFWGAPLPVADHADQALAAARGIAAAMAGFNAARAARGQAPLRVRIGIESGVAMAGDFGSSARSIYTAVGDSVNVASRLETLARELPHDIVIGPGTAALARRHTLLPIGQTTLRGKQAFTALYTLAPAEHGGAGGRA